MQIAIGSCGIQIATDKRLCHLDYGNAHKSCPDVEIASQEASWSNPVEMQKHNTADRDDQRREEDLSQHRVANLWSNGWQLLQTGSWLDTPYCCSLALQGKNNGPRSWISRWRSRPRQ
ncbi:hypothetical protein TIFTF001_017619 [Ficus carica]|uniref:Uncharacterized protein n=1 Tax=Ficus carica TaxID=3494 RepID=A0AA88A9J4_FICCA|nr:hypothetical protein TIFTF001_017619 [Ficus carica]